MDKHFANWRVVRVTEDGTPIVKPCCPRCGEDLNNAEVCTCCQLQFEDEQLDKFFRSSPKRAGVDVAGRSPGERMQMNLFDECEVHRNCTVQILHNSVTDEYSIGWWKND